MNQLKTLAPQNCPNCERKFTVQEKRNQKMQKKAKTIYLASIIILPIWWVLVYYIYKFIVDKTGHALGPSGMGGIIGVGFLMVAPGYYLMQLAYKIPKVLYLKCKGCDFSEAIIMAKK